MSPQVGRASPIAGTVRAAFRSAAVQGEHYHPRSFPTTRLSRLPLPPGGAPPAPPPHLSARIFVTASPYGPENAVATPGAVRAVSVMRPHRRALLSHEGTE